MHFGLKFDYFSILLHAGSLKHSYNLYNIGRIVQQKQLCVSLMHK